MPTKTLLTLGTRVYDDHGSGVMSGTNEKQSKIQIRES
jgi:hypothetical protein